MWVSLPKTWIFLRVDTKSIYRYQGISYYQQCTILGTRTLLYRWLDALYFTLKVCKINCSATNLLCLTTDIRQISIAFNLFSEFQRTRRTSQGFPFESACSQVEPSDSPVESADSLVEEASGNSQVKPADSPIEPADSPVENLLILRWKQLPVIHRSNRLVPQ